uniref:Gustatory receptor n=1 Tax=Strigamia maritima TaxID=126957 RepID=T1JKJ9_STRMM
MALLNGKKYLSKANLLLKYLFLPFGLDITSSRSSKNQKCIYFLVFLLFCLCYIVKVIYRVVAFTVYIVSLSPSMREFAAAILQVVPTAMAFVTHIFFYIRRSDISSSLKSIMPLLATNERGSQKQYRCLMLEIVIIMVMHFFELTGDQISISTDKEGVEYACYYYFLLKDGCKTDRARNIARFSLQFVNVFQFVNNVFISLCYCYFSHICGLLAFNFEQIVSEIHEKTETAGIINSDEITELKKRFQRSKKLTNRLSIIFSPVILIWWIFSIFSICMGVRIILDIKLERCYRLILPAIEAVRLFFLYKNESCIHHQAKCLIECFASLMPVNGHEHVFNNFYFLLKSSDVGINVSGLFLITSSSILNVIATIITYAVVLFQTK